MVDVVGYETLGGGGGGSSGAADRGGQCFSNAIRYQFCNCTGNFFRNRLAEVKVSSPEPALSATATKSTHLYWHVLFGAGRMREGASVDRGIVVNWSVVSSAPSLVQQWPYCSLSD